MCPPSFLLLLLLLMLMIPKWEALLEEVSKLRQSQWNAE
jgi:hypothetical protein